GTRQEWRVPSSKGVKCPGRPPVVLGISRQAPRALMLRTAHPSLGAFSLIAICAAFSTRLRGACRCSAAAWNARMVAGFSREVSPKPHRNPIAAATYTRVMQVSNHGSHLRKRLARPGPSRAAIGREADMHPHPRCPHRLAYSPHLRHTTQGLCPAGWGEEMFVSPAYLPDRGGPGPRLPPADRDRFRRSGRLPCR